MFKIIPKLWAHQEEMSDFVVNRLLTIEDIEIGQGWNKGVISNGYAWLLAGCGTGKTLVAYETMRRLGIKRMLVLTTKAAATQAWVGDAKIHTEGLVVAAPVGADMRTKHKSLSMLVNSDYVVYVMNYESAWRMRDHLRDFGFQMVVADESHKLKTHNSKQSKKLTELCAKIPYKVAMTGTGWDDRPTDVYGQVRWLEPTMRGSYSKSALFGTWSRFFDRYVIYHQHEHIKIVKGYKNLSELQDIIRPFTKSVNSEEVLDLPDALHIDRNLKPSREQAKIAAAMTKDWVVELEGETLTADSKLEQALRLHQIMSGYMPNAEGIIQPVVPLKSNPKLNEVLAILDELGGKPCVIFTRFRADVTALKTVLADYEVKELTGSKQEHIEWAAGAGQVLIVNIQAGSTGVNLTRARYVIYFSIGHSRTDYNQSLARVRRPGADKRFPVTYFHLIMEDSIDHEIRTAMKAKGEVADYLLKGLT